MHCPSFVLADVRLLRRALAALVLLPALAVPLPASALDYLNVTVQPDKAVPGACLSFSTMLRHEAPQVLGSFVRIAPAVDHSVTLRGKDLCIEGLRYGETYDVTIKSGLPGTDGTFLAKDAAVEIKVPDRSREVSFSNKTLLPLAKGVGLPLKSINVAKAHVVLYRFNDRAMVDHLADDWFGRNLDGIFQVEDNSTKVFEGSLDITSVSNKEVSTTIPIESFVKTLEPGVYVAVASIDGGSGEGRSATQWFSVSDVALTSVKTDSGLLVLARSLATAKPKKGVVVKLFSRANEILGSYRTDADGRVNIPGGLLRGEHGQAAKVLSAYDVGGGFAWLQVDASSLDLSDLDIKGRAAPPGNDAFVWTDRGVYRPGETVHLGALLRDRNAMPVTALPASVHIVRPDDIEVEAKPIDLSAAAGGTLDWHVPDNAISGSWRFWVSAGDKRAVGRTAVAVQDFVPPRLEAKVESTATALGPDGALPAHVSADYFYGSPGADLSGSLEVTLQTAAHPFKGLEGFDFGLINEPFLPRALKAEDFTTDAKGQADVELKAEALPDTSHPLEVELRATVNDVDGRPAVAQATSALHTGDRFVGIRRRFQALAEGATAGFDVALVDGDGTAIAGETLKWSLVKEDYSYNYFYRDGRWQSHETVIDARVNGGEVTLDGHGRGTMSAPVGNGRWRMEVYDAAGKTASSVRFYAGWWAADESENRKPETMPVTVDANPPEGKVRAMIEPSFAGRVLVMLDGNGLHGIQELEMAKGGGAVEFDAADVPTSGGYVLAMAVSPTGAVIPRLPVRAVGLAWVRGKTAARKLDVTLAAPAKIQPKTTLAVDVAASGAAPGEEAYVTLAAVDEAVLRMTSFAAPDPADHYLGRREADFEIRDAYASLIDPEGNPGRLHEGGDGKNANLDTGGLDVKTFKTVALFRGPVRLDASGHARVELAVPDFSGRLRLMATVWTGTRFGKAEAPVTVRPPMLAELTLPRFLAPGDTTRARILLTDLEAPEGTYTVAMTATGAVSLDRTDAMFKDVKRDKRRYVDRTLTAAATPGVGRIHMTVTGEDGSTNERDFELPVRTPNAYVTQRQIVEVAAGGKLTIDDALAAGLVPGTAKLDVTAATVPAIDVTGQLADLRQYPYGCAEQTISRAFPELFAKRLGAKLPVPVADSVTGQGAIQRLLSLQAGDGSFGYWTSYDTDNGNFWLTAYALDFMQHARAAGLSVPPDMESRATAWLAGRFASISFSPDEVAGASYASIVLSRADKLDTSQLRYVATRVRGGMPSDIARVQLASALARVGERDMASAIVAAPLVHRDPRFWLNDYGSPLRDAAMVLSLMAEEKLVPREALFARALDLARATGGKGYLSTQEEAWLLRAAFDLHGTTPLKVTLDGKSNAAGSDSLHAAFPATAAHVLVNRGSEPMFAAVSTTGIPAGLQPAEANGFTVSRAYHHLDGTAVDLADVHQNDELVIVIDGAMTEKVQRKVLAVDMLPAGLEPETIGLTGDRDDGQFKWLTGLTAPTFFALRDDRYMAGLDLYETQPGFRFAYVVRAVSPGTFVNPGPQVEDMYAPNYHALGAANSIEIKPARKPATPAAP